MLSRTIFRTNLSSFHRFLSSTVSFRGKQVGGEPISPNDLHRAGGIASFMRVPIAEQPPKSDGELDVAILGIPFDTATSNRPGARYFAFIKELSIVTTNNSPPRRVSLVKSNLGEKPITHKLSRFGPRHIRAESPMVRKRNHATGAQPFDTLSVADIGDVNVCLYDIK